VKKYVFKERNFYVAFFVLLCYISAWVVDKFLWIARFPG